MRLVADSAGDINSCKIRRLYRVGTRQNRLQKLSDKRGRPDAPTLTR